jgi:hypothetical protein
MKTFLPLMAALLVAGPVTAEHHENYAGKAMLDFGDTPAELSDAYIVAIDGKPVEDKGQRQYLVDPGEHEIEVVAILEHMGAMVDPIESGRDARKSAPQKTTISVEAGKRYMIGAQAKDRKGDWEPVIYDERKLK